MSDLSEKQVEAALIKYARANGVLTYKFHGPGARGKPDRIFIANHQTLFLEIKRPKVKPSVSQLKNISDIRNHGGLADWCDGIMKGKEMLNKYLDI